MNVAFNVKESLSEDSSLEKLDALVIGAGIAGLYQLYKLREIGLKVRAYEKGKGLGGVWFWNRYPGARCDSPSESYRFWISKELFSAWIPTERYPRQAETERWLNFIAEELDLKKDITFNCEIVSAHYNDETKRWLVTTADGRSIDTQFLIACSGMLSVPKEQTFVGQSDFCGQIVHTGRWPQDGLDLSNKKVALIGAGATGIQVIQTIASDVEQLTVFLRSPQYVIPMRNDKYDSIIWEKHVDSFEYFKKRASETFAGFLFDFGVGAWADKAPEERVEILEDAWSDGSLAVWLATFPEMIFDPSVNQTVSGFVRKKMRERLNNDPDLCKLLVPGETEYGFGTRRVPLDNGYLEAFLRDNVEGVDLRSNQIERLVPSGIMTSDGKVHEADIIILATGFDAGVGALSKIDVRGRGAQSLKELWEEELRAALGIQVYGFPNLFLTSGPLAPSAALCNMTTCLQQQADWIADCIKFARNNEFNSVEVTKSFEDEWIQHHDELAAGTLVMQTESWYVTARGKDSARRLLSYIGGVGEFRRRCDEIAANGYLGFAMS